MANRSVADAFTLTIVSNAILAASEEMFLVTARTAKSPIIYDVLDFSTAITDRVGDVIAQAVAVPAFIGMLDFNVRGVLAKFDESALEPGDVIILNDPYISGTHLNDVAVVMPIYALDKLVAFAASKGHWNDVGGMSFGSWGPGRTEIFQEGLQLPLCKVYAAGKPNQAVIDIIAANSRLPEVSIGDMEAQIAGMRSAARRIQEIIHKYGLETYDAAVQHVFNNGRAIAKERLKTLPKGHFSSQDSLDEGGHDGGPLPVHVNIDITDDEFRVDFSGNAAQLPFPLNTTFPGTVAAVRIVYMALVAPQEKYNQGLMAPLKVIAPEGTLFNATRPAPVSIYWEALTYAADLVWKALAPHAPERLSAGHYLSIVGEIIAGIRDDSQEPFALVEPNPGGWGAAYNQDGESGLVCFADGETFASSVEVLEARYPLRVDRYEFNTETSFGHGKYRGGAGIIKDYRILNQSADFTTDINRAIIPPWGMQGGSTGTLNRIHVYRGNKKILDTRQALSFKLQYDDVVSIRTGGGGGWGDPFERAPEAVRHDVLTGFLSIEDAERIYGVVLNRKDLSIDVEATEARRTRQLSRA